MDDPTENHLPEGRVIEDTIVSARASWSGRMDKGNLLRIVDMEGEQAVDFLCFDADNPAERYHASDTVKGQANIYINEGTVLRSSLAHPLMTVVADSCGNHDTIYGCCSRGNNILRYGKATDDSCQKNFERELASHGIGPEHVVPNINFFMHVPVGPDGAAEISRPLSKPGDYVDLRAETNVLAVLSNCPQEFNLATGANGPTPIRVIVWSAM